MSSKQLELALSLILQDKATGPASAGMDKVVKKTRDLEAASKGVTAEANNSAQALNKTGDASTALTKVAVAAKTVTAAGKETRAAFDDTSRAIEKTANAGRILGNTPIPQTLREGLRQLITDSKTLQHTLTGVKAAAGSLTLHNMARGVGGAVAGYQAGKAVVAPEISHVMDYSMRLAHMTNTAYSGQTNTEKTAGMHKLDAGIMEAVRQGGGTREEAMEAADSMIARGSIGNVDDTLKIMPLVMKTASAGQTDATSIGKIASASIKQANIPADQLDKVFGMAMYAGQQGGFELKDMSKWLPEQIATAKLAGISGLPGTAKIMALNELAIDAAGSTDAAGNNVRDFLHELNATNTANHLKNFSIDTKSGKLVEKQGGRGGGGRGQSKYYLDLGYILADNQARGMDSIQSVIGLVQRIAESDPKFVEAKRKFNVAKQRAEDAKKNGDTSGEADARDEQKAQSESVYQILLGRGVGKIFHNQQSLMGGIGAIMNPEGYQQMVADYQEKGGVDTINNAYGFLKEQSGFKLQQKQQEEANALQHGLADATSALGKWSEVVTDVYRKYPAFGVAIEGSTLALNGLTAALAGLGLMKLLIPKGPVVPPVAPPSASAVAAEESAAAGAGLAAGGSGILSFLRTFLSRVAPVLVLGGDTRQDDKKPPVDRDKAMSDMDAQMQAKGLKRTKGWLSDSYEPDTAASDASRVASIYGSAQGQADFAKRFDQAANSFTSVDTRSPLEQAARAIDATDPQPSNNGAVKAFEQAAAALTAVVQQPIIVKSELHMNDRVLAEAVNEVNGRTASRH